MGTEPRYQGEILRDYSIILQPVEIESLFFSFGVPDKGLKYIKAFMLLDFQHGSLCRYTNITYKDEIHNMLYTWRLK